MNFFTYIGMAPSAFWEQYIEPGYVNVQQHHDFPLSIFDYSRKTVAEQKWDSVTAKCRGIVINRDTGEIIARPFEKFHNYGSTLAEIAEPLYAVDHTDEPVIWEKMDGFMATLYTWNGVDYIASKGSFHSIHAKWATAWLRKTFGESLGVPAGYTAVFEGLHRDLRIVVDYGKRQELVLLALINNDTGEEFSPGALIAFADSKGLTFPKLTNKTLTVVHDETLVETSHGDEGFVLTWYQKGQPPFRLKLKFIEYLRLHRMVTGVSPKRIWEVLANNQSLELDEWLKQSTPWFSAFVTKWLKALTAEYKRIEKEAERRYAFSGVNPNEFLQLSHTVPVDFAGLRKAYALAFTTAENKPYAPVMFALLDQKDVKPVIWKMVKTMTTGANPLRNEYEQ